MRIAPKISRLRSYLRSDDGFTMIIALGVMFVTSLLLVGAYTAATGDVKLSRNEIIQKQAYYAAQAGVQEYEYQLQSNPDYWQTCKTPENTIPQEILKTKENNYNGHYVIKLLTASTAPEGTKECSTTNPFGTMIQSSGAGANTFRIESIGYAGTDKHAIVATFHVIGFLDYAYFTQYEVEDPTLNGDSSECEKYYAERQAKKTSCQTIIFGDADSVKGPIHTDDAANVTCDKGLSFGRVEHNDAIEIDGGTYPECSSSSEPTYNNTLKKPTVGKELVAPQSDTSLLSYVEEENKFTGVTHLVLNGTTKGITAEYWVLEKGVEEKVKKTIKWPKNGLLYVQAGKGCAYIYKPTEADTSNEEKEEINCGTVYVSGTYSESLTIGAQNNLIIDGNIYPTSVEGKLGSAPSGTTALGLIATEYVRIYHPITEEVCTEKENKFTKREERECSGGGENEEVTGKESLKSPWIYAAILSTSHSFIVDNYNQGNHLGNLNVYGAIAQKFRGPVGLTSGQGYDKEYIYDERLATDEPPYFLSPLNAGWLIERETSATPE
jgi:Tfp pilus assembly protein PilX